MLICNYTASHLFNLYKYL